MAEAASAGDDATTRGETDLRRYTTVEELLRDKLSDAIGGWRGAAESAVPTLAFALAWALTGNVRTSLVVAGACVVVLLLVRLAQRQNARFIAYAAVGVGISAFFALRSGRAEDAFLPGMLQNAGLMVVLLITNLTRWPLFGFVVGVAEPEALRRRPHLVAAASGYRHRRLPPRLGAHRAECRSSVDHGAALPRRARRGSRRRQGRAGLAALPRRRHRDGGHPVARSHPHRPHASERSAG